MAPPVPSDPEPERRWPLLDELERELATADPDAEQLKRALRRADGAQAAQFRTLPLVETPIDDLVEDRARVVDALVRTAWRWTVGEDARDLALIAIGGFGRGELHPASDVDLLVLSAGELGAARRGEVERFIGLLWDAGLEPGHSVHDLAGCVAQAEDDIGFATSLMESRPLAGDAALHPRMREATGPDRIWAAATFHAAKVQEQRERHLRFDDTAYNLEPNVKEGPGGLRDIQNVGWVLKRRFEAERLSELVGHHLLSRDEYEELRDGQRFLWRVRWALHLLTGRREERLLFDHQLRIAAEAGYRDGDGLRAVERFMQDYYRRVFALARLNEMLLQVLQEEVQGTSGDDPVPIDEHFARRGDALVLRRGDAFERDPGLILQLFRTVQAVPQVTQVGADVIRAVRRKLGAIDEAYRADPHNQQRFLDILRAPREVTHELRRMDRYGVLGRYLPAYGRIVGRMQFDLFHAYTVDAHTLFVVGNLRRFALERFAHEFPRCNEVMASIPDPALLYLAGLFHDIAKGRGGDHSELGARDAEDFCLEHGLSEYEARLVAWLVRHHLLLSLTAQKEDVSDPEVVVRFARTVGDQLHLDHLYLLTMADVRGTNPKLWNSWKASLFEELYERTSELLRRGVSEPIDKEALLEARRNSVIALLAAAEPEAERALALWEVLPEEHLLRHAPDELAWQLRSLQASGPDQVLVELRSSGPLAGTELFVRAPPAFRPFTRITAALGQAGLSIQDARISIDRSGWWLGSLVLLGQDGASLTDPAILADLESRLRRALAAGSRIQHVTRPAPRQVRMFDTATVVTFLPDHAGRWTLMELVTGDRPGLLSELAELLDEHELRVRGAKVTTVGERAEDVFQLTDTQGAPLDQTTSDALGELIRQRLADGRS